MTQASVVITTHNRCADALTAVASAFAQDVADLEVLVIDDASGDGTATCMRAAFPRARLIALAKRAGLIANRNLGFRKAKGTYVFSLDDDAYFTTPDIVSRVITHFERDGSIGAVAIPFIEPMARRSHSSLAHPSRSRPGDDLRSYAGCAHAVRRDVALSLDGYRELFVHQGEEADLCLRMRAAGWRVVYGDCSHVVHRVSPNREPNRISHYGIRNQILFEVLNAPLPQLPVRLVRAIAGAIRYRFSWATMQAKLRAIGAGLIVSLRLQAERQPVPQSVYRAYRALPHHGAEDWTSELPAPCTELRVSA